MFSCVPHTLLYTAMLCKSSSDSNLICQSFYHSHFLHRYFQLYVIVYCSGSIIFRVCNYDFHTSFDALGDLLLRIHGTRSLVFLINEAHRELFFSFPRNSSLPLILLLGSLMICLRCGYSFLQGDPLGHPPA